MKCKICDSKNVDVIYDDYIRDGGVGNLTKIPYKMYQCNSCRTIWHELKKDQNKDYYESSEYRERMMEGTDNLSFYERHDSEVLEKLQYTGTAIYRNKVVADIGCGGGSLLDYISNVAQKTIAIEPTEAFHAGLRDKGHEVYSYMENAISSGVKADIVVSYDVIEHVDSPTEFMEQVFQLLSDGGLAYVGTPTDAPFLRGLLGHEYEQFLFSYQHPWVLNSKSMELICQKAGFKDISIRHEQRYGLMNALLWLRDRRPHGNTVDDKMLSYSVEECFKKSLQERSMGDYIVAILKK